MESETRPGEPTMAHRSAMLGAIAGDVIGSVFEFHPIKTTRFTLFNRFSQFTDDSVLTLAVAKAILKNEDYGETIRKFAQEYPQAGYGERFNQWIHTEHPRPYNSWGNGSAMRVSPVGWAFHDAESVLSEARKSAEVTHDHPEGIKGAQAVALAIFLARSGKTKEEMREAISHRFAYDLSRSLDDIRPRYSFDVSCQGSVPEAIIAFLESESYETAIRNAISLGGDADTQAAISGSIAQAFYGEIPEEITAGVRKRLPGDFLRVLDSFSDQFAVPT